MFADAICRPWVMVLFNVKFGSNQATAVRASGVEDSCRGGCWTIFGDWRIGGRDSLGA